jgi:hypothetical protein
VIGSGFKGSGFRVLGSKVQSSAQPLAAGAASLIEKETYEHPPAMHIVRWVGVNMDILIKWLNWLHNGFKALRAGRTSNVQH